MSWSDCFWRQRRPTSFGGRPRFWSYGLRARCSWDHFSSRHFLARDCAARIARGGCFPDWARTVRNAEVDRFPKVTGSSIPAARPAGKPSLAARKVDAGIGFGRAPIAAASWTTWVSDARPEQLPGRAPKGDRPEASRGPVRPAAFAVPAERVQWSTRRSGRWRPTLPAPNTKIEGVTPSHPPPIAAASWTTWVSDATPEQLPVGPQKETDRKPPAGRCDRQRLLSPLNALPGARVRPAYGNNAAGPKYGDRRCDPDPPNSRSHPPNADPTLRTGSHLRPSSRTEQRRCDPAAPPNEDLTLRGVAAVHTMRTTCDCSRRS
jgi:hypothetical protein